MNEEMAHIVQIATEQRMRDIAFHRHVDMAVHYAMQSFEHIESEVDRRDLYHAATNAALAVLRLSIDSDAMLRQMEAERDHYKKIAEQHLRLSPFTFLDIDQGRKEG